MLSAYSQRKIITNVRQPIIYIIGQPAHPKLKSYCTPARRSPSAVGLIPTEVMKVATSDCRSSFCKRRIGNSWPSFKYITFFGSHSSLYSVAKLLDHQRQ